MRAAWQRRTLCEPPRIEQPSRVCLSRAENGLGEGDSPILQFAKSGQSPTVSDQLIGSDWTNFVRANYHARAGLQPLLPLWGQDPRACLPEAQVSVSRCMRVKCRPQGPDYRRAIRIANARRLRSGVSREFQVRLRAQEVVGTLAPTGLSLQGVPLPGIQTPPASDGGARSYFFQT